jgi:hypothetical protein
VRSRGPKAIASAAATSDTPGALTQITLAALTGALKFTGLARSTQRYQQIATTALVACHDAGHRPPHGLLAAMADYSGQAVAARPEHVLGELIQLLRGRTDIADPAGTAADLMPGITPA